LKVFAISCGLPFLNFKRIGRGCWRCGECRVQKIMITNKTKKEPGNRYKKWIRGVD
jgi:hypothetical protein